MSKKNRRLLSRGIVNRMPKVSEINLGTDIVDSTRPQNIEAELEPTQCINGHWTTTGDLDESKYCSQCPVVVEKDELDAAEDELSDALDMRENLWEDTEEICDDYDDGKD